MKRVKLIFCIILSIFVLSGCSIEEIISPSEPETLNSEGLNEDEALITDALKVSLTGNCPYYTCDYDPTTFKVLRCSDIYVSEDNDLAEMVIKIEYIKDGETISPWMHLYLYENNIRGNHSYPKGYMNSFNASVDFSEFEDSSHIHPERINTALQNFFAQYSVQ